MYQKTTFAILVALCFLGAQASNAVEEGPTFSTGDTWAFGIEIDLMEELDPEIQDIEDNITSEIIESDNFTQMDKKLAIEMMREEMLNAADNYQFEKAAKLRDEISLLEKEVIGSV